MSSTLRTYWATAVLAVANAAVYIAAWAQGADTAWLSQPGDMAAAAVRPWTLLTYMFSHAYPGHLAVNLAVLIIAGALYERRAGHTGLAGAYLGGGVAGGLIFTAAASAAGSAHASLTGASAAVLAVCAALPASDRNIAARLRRTPAALAAIGLGLAAILWGLRGANPGGSVAHIGGIAAGIVCGLFVRPPRRTISDHSEILDKARTSGFASLTDDERKKLAQPQQNDN